MQSRLRAASFPEGTPLHAFFAWNEARLSHDRRFTIARDIHALFARFAESRDGAAAAREICVAHLAIRPVIRWRWRGGMIVSASGARRAAAGVAAAPDRPDVIAARRLVDSLLATIGAAGTAAHAAVFRAFEALEAVVDLGTLAAMRPRRRAAAPPASPRNILVIKLSALGDFVQALGPAAALRRHHAGDRITLLTTSPYVEFARQTGLFDAIAVDRRPRTLDIKGWLGLRRQLREGGFDRVYDLQTSDRSSLYYRLLRPGRLPQWSGIARHCSHPHANLDRHPHHTIDKQSEQLLMAGIHPVPLPRCPVSARPLPHDLAQSAFVLLIPGSSPRHHGKRWPAAHYGELARRLHGRGYLPVVLGAPGEEALAASIRAACPGAVDLVGQTDLVGLADLAHGAVLTVGNDTGVTHIAAAGGNPVVVLFSDASEPSRCAPRGGLVRVLSKPDLADLAIETVFAEVMAVTGAADGGDPVARPLRR